MSGGLGFRAMMSAVEAARGGESGVDRACWVWLCVRLCRAGPGCAGPGCAGPGWAGLGRAGLGWAGPRWAGPLGAAELGRGWLGWGRLILLGLGGAGTGRG
ncbi:hypothetical protein L3i22_095650 [Actinoplanes sp. L3-i22]|nr:hypothetical protein L3i22_095650 [Actinoplanes sp. L3-i22]